MVRANIKPKSNLRIGPRKLALTLSNAQAGV
jgi:hypothetical protein